MLLPTRHKTLWRRSRATERIELRDLKMSRDWRTDDEIAEDRRNRPRFLAEAWATGIGMVALVLIALSYLMGWR